jgi:pimeloyl-ACP methyl ester carboxylesterase
MTTLVLVPGLGGAKLFAPLVAVAPPGVELVVVDLPKGAKNSYEELLPVVRARLPRDRPFHLLGWSFGGPLTMRLAAERPSGLRGLVLVGTFVKRPVATFPPWVRHVVFPWLFALHPTLSAGRALLGGYGTPEMRRMLIEAHRSEGPATMASRVRAALAVDATDALCACPVPILYLRASKDELIRASRCDAICAVRPDVEVAVIEGPHMALTTNPHAAWEAIARFVARTSGA